MPLLHAFLCFLSYSLQLAYTLKTQALNDIESKIERDLTNKYNQVKS